MNLKYIQKRIFTDYANEDLAIINRLLKPDKNATILDLGCGDGKLTKLFSKKIGSNKIFGTDFFPSDIKKANKVGVKCIKTNLNETFPFKNESFDVLISHFSLEHIIHLRNFVKECIRVLKPGGYILVTSDNLNSWLNIGAMILTFQPFSLTRGLSDKSTGNPFSYWADSETKDWNDRDDKSVEGAGSHIRVLSTRAAKEVFENYGFKIENLKGAGYFPFWGRLSAFFANLDPYHAHLYIIKASK
jgi:SAM-dependent methyltransferase